MTDIKLLTAKEVAVILQLHEVTVRGISPDVLPYSSVGVKGITRRYSVEDVASYIEARRTGPRLEHIPHQTMRRMRELLAQARAARSAAKKNAALDEVVSLLNS